MNAVVIVFVYWLILIPATVGILELIDYIIVKRGNVQRLSQNLL